MTRRTALGALLLPALAEGQDADTYLTRAYINGRFWLIINDFEKLGFLLGYDDGMEYAAVELLDGDLTKAPGSVRPVKLTRNEVRKELDTFYTEGVNGPIPIVHALHYIRRKSMGDSQAELEKLVEYLRKRR